MTDVVEEVAAAALAAGDPASASAVRDEAARVRSGTCRTVVVGEKKRGKSSLINALLGHPGLLPVDADVASAVHVELRHGEELSVLVFDRAHPAGVRVDPEELATHAAVDPETGQAYRTDVSRVEIRVPAELLRDNGLRLVDTPGVGGLVDGHAELALATVELADALLFVVHAGSELTSSELAFLAGATERVGAVVFALTQIDLHPAWREVLERNRALVAEHAPRYRGSPWYPVSSRYRVDADRANTSEAAAKRLERSGFPALEAELKAVAGRVESIRLANVAQFAGTIAGRLCARHADTLRTLTLDPELPAAVAAQQKELAAVTANHAGWRTTLNERLSTVERDLNRRLASRIGNLRNETTRVIASGGGDVLDAVAADLPARAEAVWLDIKSELNNQIRALGSELADRLKNDLATLNQLASKSTVDIVVAVPVRTKTNAPTVVENSLMATSVGTAVGAVVGMVTFNPLAGLAAFAGTVGLLSGYRGKRDRTAGSRSDASRHLSEVVERLRTEVPAEITQVLGEVRKTVRQAIETGLTAEKQRLSTVLAEYASNLAAAEQELASKKQAAEQELARCTTLRDRAHELSARLSES
ncbi:dynamin family protein [Amycolatopsis sp. cg5]|uniref:dynamin family protein n=1 Tax=Amycolatopsis sp. cg5 TaxID=3238802 RepID=UPI0035258BC5